MLAKLSWIVVPLLLLLGCQSASYSANCNNKTEGNVSRCEIALEQLSGQWSRDVNVSYIAELAQALPINLTVSVAQGSARVSYRNEANEEVSYAGLQRDPAQHLWRRAGAKRSGAGEL